MRPALHVLGEEALQPLRILGDRAHRQDRVAEHLELLEHAVVEPRVRVIRAAEHQERDAVLLLDLLEDRAALLLQVRRRRCRAPSSAWSAGEVVLVLGDAEQRARSLEHLPLEQRRLGEGHRRVEVADPALGEEVDLLGERRLHDLGRARHDRARRRVHDLVQDRRHVRDAGEEDVVERLLLVRCGGGRAGCGCAPARPWTGSRDRSSRTCRPRATSPRRSRRRRRRSASGCRAPRSTCARTAPVGPDVEHLRDADAHPAARLPGLVRSSARTCARIGVFFTPSSVFSTSMSSIDLRRLGHRLRVVEVPEDQLRLVVDQVRELLHQLLALLGEREHRLFRLDRALLAGEAARCSARSRRRASWCR